MGVSVRIGAAPYPARGDARRRAAQRVALCDTASRTLVAERPARDRTLRGRIPRTDREDVLRNDGSTTIGVRARADGLRDLLAQHPRSGLRFPRCPSGSVPDGQGQRGGGERPDRPIRIPRCRIRIRLRVRSRRASNRISDWISEERLRGFRRPSCRRAPSVPGQEPKVYGIATRGSPERREVAQARRNRPSESLLGPAAFPRGQTVRPWSQGIPAAVAERADPTPREARRPARPRINASTNPGSPGPPGSSAPARW